MYKFIQSSEEINSNGGFSFINKLLNGNKGMACWERLLPAARNSRYSTSAIIRSLIGIQTAGECDYADIEKFRDDFLFRGLACGEVPSQESFRQRLGRLASRRDEWREAVDGCVASQLAAARLTPLRSVLLDFIKVGCKVVRHAGQTLLNFGRSCQNFSIMKKIYAIC